MIGMKRKYPFLLRRIGMCDIWDEVRNEGEYRKACEIARKMINDGSLPLEKVAEYSGLSIEKVRELAGNKSA